MRQRGAAWRGGILTRGVGAAVAAILSTRKDVKGNDDRFDKKGGGFKDIQPRAKGGVYFEAPKKPSDPEQNCFYSGDPNFPDDVCYNDVNIFGYKYSKFLPLAVLGGALFSGERNVATMSVLAATGIAVALQVNNPQRDSYLRKSVEERAFDRAKAFLVKSIDNLGKLDVEGDDNTDEEDSENDDEDADFYDKYKGVTGSSLGFSSHKEQARVSLAILRAVAPAQMVKLAALFTPKGKTAEAFDEEIDALEADRKDAKAAKQKGAVADIDEKIEKKQEEKRQARIDEVIVAAGEKMAASEGPPHVLHILVMSDLLLSCHGCTWPPLLSPSLDWRCGSAANGLITDRAFNACA